MKNIDLRVRRDSVWSTISMIKSRLGGKSNTSFDNIREEKFWELLGSNNNTVNGGHYSVIQVYKIIYLSAAILKILIAE